MFEALSARLQAVAERLRGKVAESAEGPPVTVSVGVASFPTNALDAESLVRAADEALYESKRRGRDRVTVSRRDVVRPQGLPLGGGPGTLPETAAS